jgi:hypothetical protein
MIALSLTTKDPEKTGVDAWQCWMEEFSAKRFQCTIEQMADHIKNHHQDWTIVHTQHDLRYAKGLDHDQRLRLWDDCNACERVYESITLSGSRWELEHGLNAQRVMLEKHSKRRNQESKPRW